MNKFVNHKKNSNATSEKKRKLGTSHTTSYKLYNADVRSKVRAENPGLQFGDISRLVNFSVFFFLF